MVFFIILINHNYKCKVLINFSCRKICMTNRTKEIYNFSFCTFR